MKKLTLSLLVGLLVLGISGSAYALSFEVRDTIDDSLFTGQYMFTVVDDRGGANDTWDMLLPAVAEQAEVWFGNTRDIDFVFYDKVDAPSTGGLSMVVEYFDGEHGSWATSDPIEFYTVKGAGEFALYWLGETGATEGLWSTQHLLTPNGKDYPDISHLSGWNQLEPQPPSQVPEPSTVLLLGVGLLGLVGLGRKRSRK